MSEIHEQSPREIDTKLADLYYEASKIHGYLDGVKGALARRDRWNPGEFFYTGRERERFEQQAADYQAQLAVLREEGQPYEDEYTMRGWSRFFLVTNGNGHVHESMHCHTCYATTTYAWLPELSGKTEEDAVEEFGEKMCTVCFPSAPANPKFHAPGRRDRAALEAKAAEKAAKQSAKLTKALLPDGSPLKLSDGSPATLVAAQRYLSSTLQSLYTYNVMYSEVHGRTEPHSYTPKWNADVALLVEAIAAKTGQPADELLAEAQAKAAKKVRKDWA